MPRDGLVHNAYCEIQCPHNNRPLFRDSNNPSSFDVTTQTMGQKRTDSGKKADPKAPDLYRLGLFSEVGYLDNGLKPGDTGMSPFRLVRSDIYVRGRETMV